MRPLSQRKYSIWLILFVVLILLVFNASSWYVYSKIKFYLIQQLGERLANIASATAFGVDATKVLKAKEDPIAYEEIENLLKNIEENNQLEDAFILDQDYHDILNPSSDSASDVFLNLDLAAITQALSGTKAYSHLYQVEDYYFESGFAPIYNSSGEVMGILGVEAGADFFEVLSSFRKTLIGAFILSLLGILLLGFFFYNLTSHMRKIESAVIRTSALQAMGERVAAICHEIRNPLGIIKGTAERLRKKYNQSQDELFDFIPEEVDRLNDILGGYLEFASSEPKRKEEVDLVSLVTRIADQLKGSFAKQGIQIQVHAERDLPLVSANPGGIRQIMINLLTNAQDAIRQRGITSGVREVESSPELREGLINIKLENQEKFVVVEVEDNGRGIRKKDLKQIFNPFFSTKPEGSGLGLYVVKKIVEEHKGMISVESKWGEGTRVKIKLPVLTDETPRRARTSPRLGASVWTD